MAEFFPGEVRGEAGSPSLRSCCSTQHRAARPRTCNPAGRWIFQMVHLKECVKNSTQESTEAFKQSEDRYYFAGMNILHHNLLVLYLETTCQYTNIPASQGSYVTDHHQTKQCRNIFLLQLMSNLGVKNESRIEKKSGTEKWYV